MKQYEFTLSVTKPQIWVSKVIIESTSLNNAYYQAFLHFAIHITLWDLTPDSVVITYREL